jgi:1-aminocyclopropane-1-carboxylate deaminase/D-cysteine desulfhydrase-like pyridoxal-dependent ACC family enzyme
LTFGGAYSNHIYAAAGKLFGFNTIGIIRGEEYSPLNPTLKNAENFGMEFHYVPRLEYKHRNEKSFQEKLLKAYPDSYLIPEGGTNLPVLKGTSEIVKNIKIDFDYICCPVGTGGTISGIIFSLKGKKKVLGFSALKNGGFLRDEVRNLVNRYTGKNYLNWNIKLDYHFGGYAKINYELIKLVEEFKEKYNIELDYIYTRKMIFGIIDLISKNFFEDYSKIITVHTGGIQGNAGM